MFILYGSINDFSFDVRPSVALPGVSLPDITQNLLLYLPFGTLGVLALRRRHSVSSARARVVGLAAAYSAIMEVLQLYSATRIASPLDVVANVAGAGAGALASSSVEGLSRKAIAILRPTGILDAPTRFPLIITSIAACVVAWYPFDITLDVSTLSARTRPVRNDPWLQPGTTEMALQAIGYSVLAFIIARSLPGLRRRGPAVAALATAIAAVVIDAGQLAMGSQPVGLAVLFAQTVGGLAGAAAALVAAGTGSAWYADA